jgi:Domain of unknown function (DUF2024)
MNVAVWDTHVKKKDNGLMHFDIIVPMDITNADEIYAFGHLYLSEKQKTGSILSSNECKFCHIENASEQIILSIKQKGYFILEMEGCN